MVENSAWNVGLLLSLPEDVPVPILEHNVMIPLAVELSKYNCDYCFSVCGLISGTGFLLCCDLEGGTRPSLCLDVLNYKNGLVFNTSWVVMRWLLRLRRGVVAPVCWRAPGQVSQCCLW